LHPRRLPDLAVRAADAPRAVPLPPVHLRSLRRRQGDLRSRRSRAAAAAHRRERRGLPRSAQRLRRARRPFILGARMSTTTTTDSRSRGKAPAGERVADWADGRLGIYSLAKANMRKILPDPWSVMLGEICLYSFIIIILTGVCPTLSSHPSVAEVGYRGSYVPMQGQLMSQAYASTLDISFDVRGGLLI